MKDALCSSFIYVHLLYGVMIVFKMTKILSWYNYAHFSKLLFHNDKKLHTAVENTHERTAHTNAHMIHW